MTLVELTAIAANRVCRAFLQERAERPDLASRNWDAAFRYERARNRIRNERAGRRSRKAAA